jgi:hypothetical protein
MFAYALVERRLVFQRAYHCREANTETPINIMLKCTAALRPQLAREDEAFLQFINGLLIESLFFEDMVFI